MKLIIYVSLQTLLAMQEWGLLQLLSVSHAANVWWPRRWSLRLRPWFPFHGARTWKEQCPVHKAFVPPTNYSKKIMELRKPPLFFELRPVCCTALLYTNCLKGSNKLKKGANISNTRFQLVRCKISSSSLLLTPMATLSKTKETEREGGIYSIVFPLPPQPTQHVF